jgi:glutaredoxin
MDKHYTLYIKSDCPYCVQAREAVFRQGVNHTIYPLDKKPNRLKELKEFYNYHTVPMVFVRENGMEKLIGGYTDLIAYFDS